MGMVIHVFLCDPVQWKETFTSEETDLVEFSSEGNYSYDKGIRSLCNSDIGTEIRLSVERVSWLREGWDIWVFLEELLKSAVFSWQN